MLSEFFIGFPKHHLQLFDCPLVVRLSLMKRTGVVPSDMTVYCQWFKHTLDSYVRRVGKIAKRLSASSCTVHLSVRIVKLGSHWTDFREMLYLSIFRKSVEKIQVSLKSDGNSRYFTWRRGGAVGWGTALQARRSRVRSPMVSLEFFIDIFVPAALWPWSWLSL